MFCDFVVRFDPGKDSREALMRKILYSVYIRPMKGKKPRKTFVGGDSGEGKSLAVLKLMQILLEMQGIDIKTCLHDVNIYTPFEYPTKIEKLLFSKELKKVNVCALHEAREIVSAKKWHDFLTQAVNDINAQSRAIKRVATFVISQFIKDITSDTRYSMNYYIMASRPIGKKCRLRIYVLWKDDRDLEKPKLRKRKLTGFIVYPTGKYRRFTPDYVEVTKPDKEIIDAFDQEDVAAKSNVIKHKIDKLIKEMEQEIGVENKKISAMIEFYIDSYRKNPESLNRIGRRWHGKWRLEPDVRKMHDLTKSEFNDFEKLFNERLKTEGVI